jgi:hypothetical protein
MHDFHSLVDPVMKLLESGGYVNVVYFALAISQYFLHCLFLLKIVELLCHFAMLVVDQWLAVHEQEGGGD